MTYPKFLVLGHIALMACNPSVPATTDEASSTDTSDIPVSTSDNTPTSSESGDEPAAFSCAKARWTVVEPRSDGIDAVAVDSRGHVRFAAHYTPDTYRVLDLDAGGTISNDLRWPSDKSFIRFVGLDGDDNLLLAVSDGEVEEPRHWLRKYDISGAMQWEIDLGPSPDTDIGPAQVAADGSTVMDVHILDTITLTMRKYDAAGELMWEIPDDSFQTVHGVNASGFMVAADPFGPRVRVRTPEGATLWERTWDVPGIERAHIDAAGNVVATSLSAKIVRYAADGELLWEIAGDALPIPVSHFHDVASNADGTIAIAGRRKGGSGDIVVKLGPTGELAGDFVCDGLQVQRVAIDEAGALYLGGYKFRNGAYDAVMAAFD